MGPNFIRSFFKKREVPFLKTILEILTAALFVVLVIIVFVNSVIVNENLFSFRDNLSVILKTLGHDIKIDLRWFNTNLLNPNPKP